MASSMNFVLTKLNKTSLSLLLHHGKSSSSTTWKRNFGQKCGGAGVGNVKDQMIANTEERLFRHTKRPKTVSIIGAPMTFGQPFVGTVSYSSYEIHHLACQFLTNIY